MERRYTVEKSSGGPLGPTYDVIDTQAAKVWDRIKSTHGGGSDNGKARAKAEAARLNREAKAAKA